MASRAQGFISRRKMALMQQLIGLKWHPVCKMRHATAAPDDHATVEDVEMQDGTSTQAKAVFKKETSPSPTSLTILAKKEEDAVHPALVCLHAKLKEMVVRSNAYVVEQQARAARDANNIWHPSIHVRKIGEAVTSIC